VTSSRVPPTSYAAELCLCASVQTFIRAMRTLRQPHTALVGHVEVARLVRSSSLLFIYYSLLRRKKNSTRELGRKGRHEGMAPRVVLFALKRRRKRRK